jgi:Protein of unknown function (DUF3224)
MKAVPRAESTFVIDTWDGAAYESDAGVELARAHLSKTFTGDLQGTSTAELLSATTPAGPAAYVALERITCTLQGRSGTFVLHHSAGADGNSWTVVVGSGTGELTGLSGTGEIDRRADGSHTFALDYELSTGAASS